MDILPYLSLLILCVILLQECMASLDGDDEPSSVPHIRQKRMDVLHATEPRTREPNHPWGIIALGHIQQDLRIIRLNNPTKVHIFEPNPARNPLGFVAYAIHPFLVVAHFHTFGLYNGRNLHQFKVKSNGFERDRWDIISDISEIHSNPEHPYVLVEVKEPVLLINSETDGLNGLDPLNKQWIEHEANRIVRVRLGPVVYL